MQDVATTVAAPSATKEECFAIMPFGRWFDDYYRRIYVPAIEAAGLRARRADDLSGPSAIVEDIWARTVGARVVLADLTGRNPNVFYELGLAHAIAKPAILVTESITDVPFDLRALRVLEYDKNDPAWGGMLQERITTAIAEVLQRPLMSVLPSFLKTRPNDRPTISEHDRDLLGIRQELDVVRRELGRLGTAPRDTVDIEARVRRYVEDGWSDADIAFRLGMLGMSQRVADDVLRHARDVTPRLPIRASLASDAPDSPADPSHQDRQPLTPDERGDGS